MNAKDADWLHSRLDRLVQQIHRALVDLDMLDRRANELRAAHDHGLPVDWPEFGFEREARVKGALEVLEVWIMKCREEAFTASLSQGSEEERVTYFEPRNYWRDVFLYQQKKAGKRNADIVAELRSVAHGKGWSVISTAGGINAAIDSITHHQQWQKLRGKRGRPPSNGDSR